MRSHEAQTSSAAPRAMRRSDRQQADGDARISAILGLQRSAGNAAVGALLQRRTQDAAATEVLRDFGIPLPVATVGEAHGPTTVQRRPEVPGLSKSAEATAKPLLSGSAADKQKAVDIVFAELKKKGRIGVPLAKLDGKKVHYDAAVAGEGLTSTTYDASGKPTSCRVAIGDAAFSSLPWLYSSIIHELKHAQQRLAVKLSKLASSAMRETEAYAVEILKAHQSGVITDKARMEDLWTRLHDDHWVNITVAKEKKRMQSKVKKAHKIAEKATGKTLTFTP
jgi:hypothetical protein